MKCDLCGSVNTSQREEKDIVHNRLETRRVLVCNDCGYRRSLQECHSEADMSAKDITEQQIAREKTAAYQKIRMERTQSRPANGGYRAQGNPAYRPPNQPAQNATSSLTGCLVMLVIGIVVLGLIFGAVSNYL